MAGDWIKVEHSLPDKPEVIEMAESLGIDADAVVGKLLRVWVWFDNHSENGNAPVTVRALLNRHAGVSNFVEAMLGVGWMLEVNGRLIIENFDRHNGKTAKLRANTNRRVAKSRKCNADTVTNATHQALQKPLPEKRREENSILTRKSKNNTARGSLEELKLFAVELGLPASDGEAMFYHWEANGWRNGRSPSKDWRAGIRKWKSQGWLPSQKAAGQAPNGKPRLTPDIGGRKPSAVASWENAPPAVHRPDDQIEF